MNPGSVPCMHTAEGWVPTADDSWGLGATDTCQHLQPVSSTWGHMVENDVEWTWEGSSSTEIHCKNWLFRFYVSFRWQEYMRKREKEQASSLAIKDGAGLLDINFFELHWFELCLNSLGFSTCFGFLKVRYQSQQSWWLVYLNQESGRVAVNW